MPRRYPPEFRRTVLDLVGSCRRVAQIATDLDVSDQTIYNWRRLAHSGQSGPSVNCPIRCARYTPSQLA
jgi:transposase-like protein